MYCIEITYVVLELGGNCKVSRLLLSVSITDMLYII